MSRATPRRALRALPFALLLSALAAAAQDTPPPASASGPVEAAPAAPAKKRFRLHAELKAHARSSRDIAVKDNFPFPPNFIPPGQDAVFLRTVDPHGSLEVSNVALVGEADLTPDIAARVVVHFLDLYNRNPTSSDDRVAVREAWVRFGHEDETMQEAPGTRFYLKAGKAPRFSKHLERPLESYGLWGTAVGRFEEVQVQAGGSFGKHVYFRLHASNGNPIFFRDPNALAGDNGTPERVPGNVHPIYQSGFPILYDAKANDTSFDGRFELGGGLGFKWVNEAGDGVDVLGWYFRRNLADRVPIRGSFYSGDLLLLTFGFSLPVDGREKREAGVNVSARFHGATAFVQYVNQEIAGLPREGIEAELAYLIDLHGLFLSGETTVFDWIQPAVRVSILNNHFAVPRQNPAPSLGWDWRKYDFGFRLGVIRGVDLTVEYSRNDMRVAGRFLHPDEGLVTLRAGF